jgi:anti-anti-sigma regulatory factor
VASRRPSSSTSRRSARATAARQAPRSEPSRSAQRTPVRRRSYALGAALTISEVGDCQRGLRRLLLAPAAPASTCIDAHALRTLDTAGLQLLLAAGRHAQQRGGRLALLGAGELVRAAAAALGLGELLGSVLELPA